MLNVLYLMSSFEKRGNKSNRATTNVRTRKPITYWLTGSIDKDNNKNDYRLFHMSSKAEICYKDKHI